MSNEGKKCTVHYTGTFNDGTKFDSSYDRGEPIDFVCGAGMMIKGFDEAVKGMAIGDIIDVHLMPEEAYGMPDPDNILTVEINQLRIFVFAGIVCFLIFVFLCSSSTLFLLSSTVFISASGTCIPTV